MNPKYLLRLFLKMVGNSDFAFWFCGIVLIFFLASCSCGNPIGPQVKAVNMVAVGSTSERGYILGSEKGALWQPLAIGTTNMLVDAIFTNNQLIAVGAKGTIVRSVNYGATWKVVDSKTTQDLHQIIFASNRFVAVGKKAVLLSDDGETWRPSMDTGESLAGGLATADLSHMIYAEQALVVVGNMGRVFSSFNTGDMWEGTTAGPPVPIVKIAYGKFDSSAAPGTLEAAIDSNFIAIASLNLVFEGERRGDAFAWSEEQIMAAMNEDFKDVLFAEGKIVIVGDAGTIVVSSDFGISWMIATTPTDWLKKDLKSLHYIEGEFFALGEGGTIIRSGDSLTWVVETDTRVSANLFNYMAYREGVYVLVGERGTILMRNKNNKWSVATLLGGGTTDFKKILVLR